MELATINIPRHQARAAYREYKAALKQQHSTEDEMMMRAYKAIARGEKVLNIVAAFQAAGLDEYGRPKLAIARADAQRIHFSPAWRSGVFSINMWHRVNESKSNYVRLPEGCYTSEVIKNRITAIVPSVPPQYRPHGKLSGYHLLWEPDWKEPPKDPILLKQLSGYLFAVLAVWDLTDVERAVLAMTRRG